MACDAPCFGCPFARASDVGVEGEPYEFYRTYMVEFEPYICPEQEALCFGQITMIANQRSFIMMSEDNELYREAQRAKIDRVRFFWLDGEFIRHHRGESHGRSKHELQSPRVPVQMRMRF